MGLVPARRVRAGNQEPSTGLNRSTPQPFNPLIPLGPLIASDPNDATRILDDPDYRYTTKVHYKVHYKVLLQSTLQSTLQNTTTNYYYVYYYVYY